MYGNSFHHTLTSHQSLNPLEFDRYAISETQIPFAFLCNIFLPHEVQCAPYAVEMYRDDLCYDLLQVIRVKMETVPEIAKYVPEYGFSRQGVGDDILAAPVATSA